MMQKVMKDVFLNLKFNIMKKFNGLHNDLPFLPERTKIGKVEKLVTNLHDETKYVIHMRNLKQALNYGLILRKVHRVINFNQNAWLKLYKLRKKTKNNFEKDFFKLMNDAVFGKTVKHVRKYRDIKLVTTERRKIYLVSEPNYLAAKFFAENLLAIEMRKTQIIMNKPVYLGLSIPDLSKTVNV